MQTTRPPLSRSARSRGFTLVEVMIAVAIVGIIAAIAIPAFTESVRKSRRAEGFAALANVQQAQERWRGNNAAYSDDLANSAAVGSPPNGLGIAATTSTGYYGLSLSGVGATGYTVTATGTTGTTQAADGGCKLLAARMAGGNLLYGSGASTVTFWTTANPDPNRCWAR